MMPPPNTGLAHMSTHVRVGQKHIDEDARQAEARLLQHEAPSLPQSLRRTHHTHRTHRTHRTHHAHITQTMHTMYTHCTTPYHTQKQIEADLAAATQALEEQRRQLTLQVQAQPVAQTGMLEGQHPVPAR